MGFWANSRAILTQGLPLSYCLALENISERSEVEVLPSQSPGGYQEEEVRESRLFAHYKKAGAEGKGQKLPGGGWLQFTEGIAEVKGQGIGGMIRKMLGSPCPSGGIECVCLRRESDAETSSRPCAFLAGFRQVVAASSKGGKLCFAVILQKAESRQGSVPVCHHEGTAPAGFKGLFHFSFSFVFLSFFSFFGRLSFSYFPMNGFQLFAF